MRTIKCLLVYILEYPQDGEINREIISTIRDLTIPELFKFKKYNKVLFWCLVDDSVFTREDMGSSTSEKIEIHKRETAKLEHQLRDEWEREWERAVAVRENSIEG